MNIKMIAVLVLAVFAGMYINRQYPNVLASVPLIGG